MDLKKILEEALEIDPSIIADMDTVGQHPGKDVQYLAGLGLTRPVLKKLERYGLAVRAYKRVRLAQQEVTELRWILLARDPSHGKNAAK